MPFIHYRNQTLTIPCKKCNAPAIYDQRRVYGDLYFHLYKCLTCKGYTSSPTTYAKCEKFGIIVRDTGHNDCLLCPIKTQKCQYFKEKEKLTYEEITAFIEKQIKIKGGARRKFRIVPGDKKWENH